MLILTRKKDEGIRIGNNIYLKVIDVSGNQVKLGVDAPTEVAILRDELFEAVKKDNVASIATKKPDINSLPEFIKQKKADTRP